MNRNPAELHNPSIMSTTASVDKLLGIMYNLGFVDRTVNTHVKPTAVEENRTAEIFFSWIRKVTNRKEAREKGVKIGQLICLRAVAREFELRHAARMLTWCGNWYHNMLNKIETEIEQERDDISLGRIATKAFDEKEERKQLERICKFMMVLLTAAHGEVDKVLNDAK